MRAFALGKIGAALTAIAVILAGLIWVFVGSDAFIALYTVSNGPDAVTPEVYEKEGPSLTCIALIVTGSVGCFLLVLSKIKKFVS